MDHHYCNSALLVSRWMSYKILIVYCLGRSKRRAVSLNECEPKLGAAFFSFGIFSFTTNYRFV